jgi:hypothetical protein
MPHGVIGIAQGCHQSGYRLRVWGSYRAESFRGRGANSRMRIVNETGSDGL